MLTNIREIYQIYCLKQVATGYMPVNREYKPIGCCSDSYVNYDNYQQWILPIQFTPEEAAILSWNRSEALPSICLYQYACRPFRTWRGDDVWTLEYLERLGFLDHFLKEQVENGRLRTLKL